jgi:WD40 repeat protein
MISCSNDKTIKLWKIPDLNVKGSANAIESFYSTVSLNTLHNDYIKAIAYSEKSANLFSVGLDGRILMMNLDDLVKYQKDFSLFQDFHSLGTNNSSVFAVDCDLSGDLMIASVYENVKNYFFIL